MKHPVQGLKVESTIKHTWTCAKCTWHKFQALASSNRNYSTGNFKKVAPTPKTFWNIFISVKSFCVKFCKFIGNSYSHICYQFL